MADRHIAAKDPMVHATNDRRNSGHLVQFRSPAGNGESSIVQSTSLLKTLADKGYSPVRKTATYIIEDICIREEYIDSLRKEIQKAQQDRANPEMTEEQVPLLDSFMKESIRFTNPDASE